LPSDRSNEGMLKGVFRFFSNTMKLLLCRIHSCEEKRFLPAWLCRTDERCG